MKRIVHVAGTVLALALLPACRAERAVVSVEEPGPGEFATAPDPTEYETEEQQFGPGGEEMKDQADDVGGTNPLPEREIDIDADLEGLAPLDSIEDQTARYLETARRALLQAKRAVVVERQYALAQEDRDVAVSALSQARARLDNRPRTRRSLELVERELDRALPGTAAEFDELIAALQTAQRRIGYDAVAAAPRVDEVQEGPVRGHEIRPVDEEAAGEGRGTAPTGTQSQATDAGDF